MMENQTLDELVKQYNLLTELYCKTSAPEYEPITELYLKLLQDNGYILGPQEEMLGRDLIAKHLKNSYNDLQEALKQDFYSNIQQYCEQESQSFDKLSLTKQRDIINKYLKGFNPGQKFTPPNHDVIFILKSIGQHRVNYAKKLWKKLDKSQSNIESSDFNNNLVDPNNNCLPLEVQSNHTYCNDTNSLAGDVTGPGSELSD